MRSKHCTLLCPQYPRLHGSWPNKWLLWIIVLVLWHDTVRKPYEIEHWSCHIQDFVRCNLNWLFITMMARPLLWSNVLIFSFENECLGITYSFFLERQNVSKTIFSKSWLITLLPSLIASRWVGRQTQWWPRHKAIYFSWFWPDFFCLLLGPPGFNCWFSFAPVFQQCLFDTPGISRCRSQHVPVESSSLLHHSIYLWFICFPWWSIDELENLHTDRTTVCFEPW